MPDGTDEYRAFILSAEPTALMRQFNMDIRTPLTSAQNIAHMLAMMQTPSESIQRKIDSGELNAVEMLDQLSSLITQAFDVLDFYRTTLGAE